MWRGLILNRAVQQFLEDVRWGELDYLLIDMPPGTGDIQMGLARMLPRTEVLVVTTPPLAAQKVAARAADMARKGHLRVAGVIENMSAFTCDHGTSYALFGKGGGERLSAEIGVPLVGTVPLHPDMAASGDAGTPVASSRASWDSPSRRWPPHRRGRGAGGRGVGLHGPPARPGRSGAGQPGLASRPRRFDVGGVVTTDRAVGAEHAQVGPQRLTGDREQLVAHVRVDDGGRARRPSPGPPRPARRPPSAPVRGGAR